MDKRELYTIIFGKEDVSDEELWDAGFGDCGKKIEVESENISKYSKYKKGLIRNKILRRIGDVKTDWVELPRKQKDQIETVMKLIAYAVISLEPGVSVKNATCATNQFLRKLGYNVFGRADEFLISWYDSKKIDIATGYLTAETADNMSNFINNYVLYSFLTKKKYEGKKYVFIPIADILIVKRFRFEGEKDPANDFFEQLNLEFDLETFVMSHGWEPLVFIDLRHFGKDKKMQQTKELEPLKKYLEVKL